MHRTPPSRENKRPQPSPKKSFTRYEPPAATTPTRARDNSLPSGSSPLAASSKPADSKEGLGGDIFESGDGDDAPGANDDSSLFPDSAEELPVEIQSLMERFIESLSLKKHSAPISADQLSELYQNFYAHCNAQISTHIASLSTRLSRGQSPAPSISSISSSKSRVSRKNSKPLESTSEEPLSDQQMLTSSEITDRKKQRRQLEVKRLALEEAVERGVCEKVYAKVWRHKSTDDQERDERVRSRAAALSVVGVDLKELLSGPPDGAKRRTARADRPDEDPARGQLADARSHILSMNEAKYPLGKLHALTAAHKSIVETLSQMFPSMSSADEVLPTLIYTIVTLQPNDMHVVSDLNFIQRFRDANKIDGETAYCLTNLEAAISFLENVDLSSLRPEDSASRSSSPPKEGSTPLYQGLPSDSPRLEGKEKGSNEPPSSPSAINASRRLSTLLQSRPRPLEAATGIVSSGADAAYDTIQNALDGSMKFFFGRMKEKQSSISSPTGVVPEITVPRTLEDARKLVSTPPPIEDDASLGGDSQSDIPAASVEQRSKALDLVTGRKAGRDGSAERQRHPQSAQKSAPAGAQATAANAALASVESVRNLGNTLNPLKGFSAMGSFRGFGRSANASPTPSVHGHSPAPSDSNIKFDPAGLDVMGVGAPIQKFVDCKEAKELNFYDVDLLLRDYQRLSGVLRALQTPTAPKEDGTK